MKTLILTLMLLSPVVAAAESIEFTKSEARIDWIQATDVYVEVLLKLEDKFSNNPPGLCDNQYTWALPYDQPGFEAKYALLLEAKRFGWRRILLSTNECHISGSRLIKSVTLR